MTATADDPPPSLAAAEVVAGRYRVERLLERESAVESYVVTDLLEQRPLVLKLLVPPKAPGLPTLAPAAWQRPWLLQMTALTGLKHLAVAYVVEARIDEVTGRAWVVREPIELEGRTLREAMAGRGRAFSETEAVAIAAQIGEALEAAHHIGLCHRCLSPARVFLIPDGAMVRIRVADFGLLPASWVRGCAEPGYLAPEQIAGGALPGPTAQSQAQSPPSSQSPQSPQLNDRRADQFALAVILYELLAGQPAFIAAADEPRDAIHSRIVNEDPLPLSLSRPVELSLSRALSRSPAVRFPSVRELIRALGGDTSRWPQATLPPQLVPQSGASPKRILLPMATGALIALVGLAIFAWFGGQRRPEGGQVPARGLDLAAAVPGDLASGGPAPVPAPVPGQDLAAVADLAPVEVSAASDLGAPPDLAIRFPPLRGPSDGPVLSAPPRPPAPPPGTTQIPPRPPVAPSGPLALNIAAQGGALSAEQDLDLKSCVRIVRPVRPFRVTLQNIAGRLLVAAPSSFEFSASQDFRDCLKLRVKGTLAAKVVTITGTSKGRPSP